MVDYKDIALAFMQGATLDSIKALGASKKTLRRAAMHLHSIGEEEASRSCHTIAEAIFPDNRGRGPQVGQDRTYTVQQDARGSLFVRVSPSTLDVQKGDKVHAKFKRGKVELTAGFVD